MLPEEQEDENKKMIGQEEEAMEGDMPDHTHPELDQVLVKLQEIEQRLSTMETSDSAEYEDPMMEKSKEELSNAPERESDNESTKKINTENPEKLPQTGQPSNGSAPGDDNYQKYDNKAKDVESKAISATPNASGKIPKEESVKLKIDVEEDGKKEEEKPLEAPISPEEASPAAQVPPEAPVEKDVTEEPGIKKLGEMADEEEEKKMEEQADPMSTTAGTSEDPTQRKPEDAPAQPNAMKQNVDPALTQRQSVVSANGQTQQMNAEERQMGAVQEYLQKTGHSRMFKKLGGN